MSEVIIGSMVGTTYFKRLAYWQLPYNLYHQLGKLRRSLTMTIDPIEYFLALAKICLIEEELIYLGYPPPNFDLPLDN